MDCDWKIENDLGRVMDDIESIMLREIVSGLIRRRDRKEGVCVDVRGLEHFYESLDLLDGALLDLKKKMRYVKCVDLDEVDIEDISNRLANRVRDVLELILCILAVELK